MTVPEFSNAFDTIANSYFTAAPFGDEVSKQELVLDEYEKSYYLTRFQEELVINLYTGKTPYGESFEETEELRRYLAPLVTTKTYEPFEYYIDEWEKPNSIGESTFFKIDDKAGGKVLFIIYEAVGIGDKKGECDKHTMLDVIPVTHDEYHKIKRNPFRGANYRRALRLDLEDNIVEIVSKYPIDTYFLRYIRRPKPILLTDLEDGLSIQGVSKTVNEGEQACELPETIHWRIVEGAVELAAISRGYTKQQQNNDSK